MRKRWSALLEKELRWWQLSDRWLYRLVWAGMLVVIFAMTIVILVVFATVAQLLEGF